MKSWLRVLALCSAVASTPVMAELEIVTGNDYEPFTDEELPEGGLATQLVVETFEELGYEVDIDFRPWARGYHDTMWGLFVGTFPYVHTDERAEDMIYPEEPLSTLQEMVISAADNPIEFQGPDSLAGMRVCRPVGYAYPDPVTTLIENGDLDVTEPDHMSSCPRMVELGRVDFFVANTFTWPGLVIAEELDETAYHADYDNPIAEMSLYFIAPQTEAGRAIIEEFDQGMRTLRESGRYDEIVDAHVEEAAE